MLFGPTFGVGVSRARLLGTLIITRSGVYKTKEGLLLPEKHYTTWTKLRGAGQGSVGPNAYGMEP